MLRLPHLEMLSGGITVELWVPGRQISESGLLLSIHFVWLLVKGRKILQWLRVLELHSVYS